MHNKERETRAVRGLGAGGHSRVLSAEQIVPYCFQRNSSVFLMLKADIFPEMSSIVSKVDVSLATEAKCSI